MLNQAHHDLTLEVEVLASVILNLVVDWRYVIIFTPWPLLFLHPLHMGM